MERSAVKPPDKLMPHRYLRYLGRSGQAHTAATIAAFYLARREKLRR